MIRTRLAAVLVVLTLGFGQVSTSLVQAQERREGINVHGHWVIDIRNPDGTLVTHRAFENALDERSGTDILTRLLVRSYRAGPWYIRLRGPAGPIVSTILISQVLPNGASGGLSVTSNPGVAPDFISTFTLTGSIRAQTPGAIATVETLVTQCDPGQDVATCNNTAVNAFAAAFTSADLTAALGAPLSVAAGQLIEVTVTISFS